MSEPFIICRGYKYRLRTQPKHEALLRRYAGCCRKVWNLALAEQQARRERGESYVNYVGMAKWLTKWRGDPATAYLRQAPVHSLQNTLKALDEAFQRFFKQSGGYPKFKRYGQDAGIRETDVACFAVDVTNSRIKLPKLGWIRYRNSRDFEGLPKNVTVTREANGWHVSVQTERVLDKQPVPAAVTIGAGDRGITNFLATAEGSLVKPLNAHKGALVKLRRYQRACARKIEAAKVKAGIPKDKPFPKGFKLDKSGRLCKAQARLAKHQARIARVRADWLHKLSTRIADTHAAFCLEDLNIQNMSASARGDAERPGRNGSQKSGLNRSILDQGWHAFKVQLGYKLLWRGGQLVLVPPQYTSQRCACCGHIDKLNRKGEQFKCLACGHEDHADINAAKNILAAGHAVLSGEQPEHAVVEDAVQQDRPVKRLPTEGLHHAA